MEDCELVKRAPTVEEYRKLREAVGWGNVDAGATRKGLDGALFSVCAVKGSEVVGCGRVIGDGGIYFYVQDVIVLPGHQDRGIGRLIMEAVMDFIGSRARPNAFVGMMAAKGAKNFHERFGFVERPKDAPGMYMIWKG